MSSNINGHENIGHAHRSSYVTNVAKVEVGRLFYLQVEAEDNRASRRWRGFIVMELRYEGEN
jgi:hypothetical protein